jgi:hypothetical protein
MQMDFWGHFKICMFEALLGVFGAIVVTGLFLAIVAAVGSATSAGFAAPAFWAVFLGTIIVLAVGGTLVSLIACAKLSMYAADADALADTSGGATAAAATSGATRPLCIPCAVFEYTWIRTGILVGAVAVVVLLMK